MPGHDTHPDLPLIICYIDSHWEIGADEAVPIHSPFVILYDRTKKVQVLIYN